MSEIIQVINPRRRIGPGGEQWVCAACGSKYDEQDEARLCAETDHVTGRHKRATRPDEPFDMVCPPCDLDSSPSSPSGRVGVAR